MLGFDIAAQQKPFNFYESSKYSLTELDSLSCIYEQKEQFQELALVKVAQSRKQLQANGLIIHTPTLRLLLEAKKLFGTVGDSLNYHLTNIEINTNLFKENKNALQELQQAYEYFHRHDDLNGQLMSSDFVLSYHIHYKNYDKALIWKRLIEKKIKNISPTNPNDSLSFSRVYFKFSYLHLEVFQSGYKHDKHLDQAELYANLSGNFCANLDPGADWLRFVNKYFLGIIAQFRGQYQQALIFFHSSEPFVQDNLARIRLCKHLSQVYFRLNKYDKAKEYLEKSFTLTENLHQEHLKDIFRYGTTWESLSDMEAENLLIKEREKNLQNQAEKRQQSFLFLGISAIAAAAYWIQRQRHQEQKNKGIIERQLLSLQKDSARKLIDSQEQERQLIARELHDSFGGMLSIAKLTAESLLVTPTPKNTQALITLLDQAHFQLRDLLSHFQPHSVESIPLTQALSDWLEQIARGYPKVKVNFETTGDECGDKSVHHQLFRVVQELVYNAIKHATAQHISVEVNYFEDNIIILVQDDGKGFLPSEIIKGHGLSNIEARLTLLSGHVEFEQGELQGTHVLIHIPIKK